MSTPPTPSASTPVPGAHFYSAGIIYDEIKAITDRLAAERDALNTRASFILGSGSIVVGAVTALLGAVAVVPEPSRTVLHWGVAGDALCYLVVAYFAGRAYATNKFVTLNERELPTKVLDTEEETRRFLIGAYLALYTTNEAKLGAKEGFLVVALRALVVEILWLGILLITLAITV